MTDPVQWTEPENKDKREWPDFKFFSVFFYNHSAVPIHTHIHMDQAKASIRSLLGIQASTKPQERQVAVRSALQLWYALPLDSYTKSAIGLLQAMDPTFPPHVHDNLLWNLFVHVCGDKKEKILEELAQVVLGKDSYVIPHATLWLLKQ